MSEATADPLGRAVAEAIERVLPSMVERITDQAGPRAYSVAEAAAALRVSEPTVYRLVRTGKLARIPHISMVRIAASALDDFMRGKVNA